MDNFFEAIGELRDLDGNPIEKTPTTHPYNYDEHVIWMDKDFNKEECYSAVYSDRLFQWDDEKYEKCCQEVFGNRSQYFYSRDHRDIEEFLGKYLNKDIKLTAVILGCNVSTGYPYWVFYYKEDAFDDVVYTTYG